MIQLPRGFSPVGLRHAIAVKDGGAWWTLLFPCLHRRRVARPRTRREKTESLDMRCRRCRT